MKDHGVTPDVILLRHGRTTANDRDLIDGQHIVDGRDIGGRLTDFGREQVYKRAHALREQGIHIEGIFTSDLDRTLETTAIFRQAFGQEIPMQADKRLREISMGDREGTKRPHRILSRFAAKAMRGINWPLAHNGESHVEVQERLEKFIEEELNPRLAAFHAHQQQEGTFLIVSHDLPIQIMSQVLNNNEPPITADVDAIGNAEYIPFDTRDKKHPFIHPLLLEAARARKRSFGSVLA